MSTAMVSRAKYEAAVSSGRQAVARARETAGRVGWRQTAGTFGGAALAGGVDAKMGEGSASMLGVGLFVAGFFLKMPDLVNAGTGMLTPAIYRAARAKVSEMAVTTA